MIQVLDLIPKYPNRDILVGFDTADDAGVFRLDEDKALVQTLDFFSPVVDDPRIYGAIAAANSLSDVYAMGGKPITAMAIVCFPEREISLETLGRIMAGGAEKLNEAGVALLGGHSVVDPELKFGYAVTGLVHPGRILSNAGALPGDELVLTKPLGIGILTTGIKFGRTSQTGIRRACEIMTSLNGTAAEIMLRYRCHAATDVTGNGLLGHAREMAEAGGVTVRLFADRIPYVPEAYPLAEENVCPGMVRKILRLIEGDTVIAPTVSQAMRNILLDPQTSGGLLIAVDPSDLEKLLRDLRKAQIEAAHVGGVEKAASAKVMVDGTGIR